jgi:hypothetical protein
VHAAPQNCTKITRHNPMNRLKKRSIVYKSKMQLIRISQRPELSQPKLKLNIGLTKSNPVIRSNKSSY